MARQQTRQGILFCFICISGDVSWVDTHSKHDVWPTLHYDNLQFSNYVVFCTLLPLIALWEPIQHLLYRTWLFKYTVQPKLKPTGTPLIHFILLVWNMFSDNVVQAVMLVYIFIDLHVLPTDLNLLKGGKNENILTITYTMQCSALNQMGIIGLQPLSPCQNRFMWVQKGRKQHFWTQARKGNQNSPI